MVEFLEIQDKKYPIIVNFYVIGLFEKETGAIYDDLTDLLNKLYLVEPLLWYSLKYGALVAKEPFSLIREDIPLLLIENKIYSDFLGIIGKFFPKEKVEEVKKK